VYGSDYEATANEIDVGVNTILDRFVKNDQKKGWRMSIAPLMVTNPVRWFSVGSTRNGDIFKIRNKIHGQL
jgi:hypothetical protein